MAQKLYIDGLRAAVFAAHKYGTRYQAQLSLNLTGPQYTALLSFVACCADLLAKLGANVITPDP
jgi:hypothetical protein